MFIIFFFLAVIQLSLLSNLSARHLAPEAVLVLIAVWSFRKDFSQIWPWVALAGFIMDIMTFSRIGLNMVSFLIISFGVSYLAGRFSTYDRFLNISMLAGFIAVGTAFNLFFLNAGALEFWDALDPMALVFGILSNLIIFPFVYLFISKFKRFFQIPENKLAAFSPPRT